MNLQILGIYRHVDVQNNFTKTLKLFFFLISLLWAVFFSMRLTTGTLHVHMTSLSLDESRFEMNESEVPPCSPLPPFSLLYDDS